MNGVNPKDILGMRKAPLHLVPPALAIAVSQVFGFSAGSYPSVRGHLKEKVYGPYNWREKPVRLTIYLDAIERHLLALRDGETNDPETGFPHAAHIGANVAILLDATSVRCLVDDRTWKQGEAAGLLQAAVLPDVSAPGQELSDLNAGASASDFCFTCGFPLLQGADHRYCR